MKIICPMSLTHRTTDSYTYARMHTRTRERERRRKERDDTEREREKKKQRQTDKRGWLIRDKKNRTNMTYH